MNVAELMDLYEYNRWAHERTLEGAAQLTKEQYERQIPGSFPSLRATLEHILAAEVVWLSRWEGHSLGDTPDFTGVGDASALHRIWHSFWGRQFSFLQALTEDEMTRPVFIRTRSGIETVQPLGETMIHVVNHGTYHRGQAATLVRQVGGTPSATDYFVYCLTKGN